MIEAPSASSMKGLVEVDSVAVSAEGPHRPMLPGGQAQPERRPPRGPDSGSRAAKTLSTEGDQCLQMASDGSGLYVCDPGRRGDWDLRWRSMPTWSVFHGAAWADVLQRSYGFSPCYLEWRGADGQFSMLPLMEARSIFLGRRGVSLPFSDVCPALCAVPAHSRLLLEGALALARRRGWRYLELRGGDLTGQCGPASLLYYEHLLDLWQDENRLFARFKQELRTAIRKAQKSGLQIEIGTELELVKQFFQLHAGTRQRQGVPIQPFSFFKNVHRQLLEKRGGVVVVARRGDKPVAGAVFFHSETSAVFKFGASDPAWLRLRPNNLVMWEAIRWYLRQGVKSLHLGRTSVSNQGLRRFKLAWGTAEDALSYYRIDPSAGRTMAAVDRSSSGFANVFRYLPVPALRVIGRLFYRHMD